MLLINWADRIIKYSFYLLFLLIPLLFTNNTSELFEFNKMWATFALTIIVTGAWAAKMVAQKKFSIQRTPLDIPIGLFLLSQIISTIISLDPHTSLWGYYTRFNGGLLSIISYILLYYAFVSNLLDLKAVKKFLTAGLASGAIVALWGLPSHFGYDPTCFLFRGSLDVSCWTIDFQPKLRIFSTLGQPNWLAAYLGILLPISVIFAINEYKNKISIKFLLYSGLSFLFGLDLLYTRSQSGLFGILAAFAALAAIPIFDAYKKGNKKLSLILKTQNIKLILGFIVVFLLTVFFAGSPFERLDPFTFKGITSKIDNQKTTTTPVQSAIPALELNITSSWDIRLVVWKGALDIWRHYPVFGTGVETFAYAYYQYRPAEHNLTSEWNFLYNKAHNEYLNFLTTTGTFGFATYIFMIGYFLYLSVKTILKKEGINEKSKLLSIGLVASYVSILVTNSIGFSVVIINIFFFLIPAFAFICLGLIDKNNTLTFQLSKKKDGGLSRTQQAGIAILIILCLYLLLQLFRYWNADKAYYLGSNLDRAQQYQTAYPYLQEAISQRPNEPVFQDEFAINNGVIAASLMSVAQTQSASESAQAEPVIQSLLQTAIQLSNKITSEHPNNIVFWKSRVRLFYTLSQVDPQYLAQTLEAIKKAQSLAPTDATISYNLGILQGQSGDFDAAIKTLENTVSLRPNYKEARFGLALFYHQQAIDKNNRVVNEDLEKKAIEQLEYILKNIDPNDEQVKNALQAWNVE